MEISIEHGFLSWSIRPTALVGRALVFETNRSRSRDDARRAGRAARAWGRTHAALILSIMIADACLQLGRIDLGLDIVEQCFESIESLGTRLQEPKRIV